MHHKTKGKDTFTTLNLEKLRKRITSSTIITIKKIVIMMKMNNK